MNRPLSRDEIRAYDRIAIDRGVPGPVLMENASRGLFELLRAWGIDGPVAILCGKGNNAGDGFCLARLLASHGFEAVVWLAGNPTELAGDAATAFAPLAYFPITIRRFEPNRPDALLHSLRTSAWVVDALLGTGVRGEIREPFARMITLANESGRPIVAVDLPSGLDADTGEPLGPTILAAATMSFVAEKAGFAHPAAADFLGRVHVVPVGVGQMPFR